MNSLYFEHLESRTLFNGHTSRWGGTSAHRCSHGTLASDVHVKLMIGGMLESIICAVSLWALH